MPSFSISKAILLPIILVMLILASAYDASPPAYHPDAENTVYWVSSREFEKISENRRLFLKKVLTEAENKKIKAVVFELDTPGGRVDVALKYVTIMRRAAVPVIVYLNPRGISAGMIIALAGDRIVIDPHGTIGDAMPVQMGPDGAKPVTKRKPGTEKKPEEKKSRDEKTDTPDILKQFMKKDGPTPEEKRLTNQKFLSFFFKELETLAEKNDRPRRVVRAMADPYITLTKKRDGIDHKGDSPLTLSAKEALRLQVVDYQASSVKELLAKTGLSGVNVHRVKHDAFEDIASFLAHPALSGMLIVLGLIGIFIEIRTPGFGVPGMLGLTALTLFFLGHILAGHSDWGPPVVFFVGLMLITLEVFVIPGFGIVGVLGGGCLLISLMLAFGDMADGMRVVALSILVGIPLMIFLSVKVLPKSAMFKRLTLATEQEKANGYSSYDVDDSTVGKRGTALCALRPAGIAEIENTRYDVVTRGDWIERGAAIEVVDLKGMRMVVKKIEG